MSTGFVETTIGGPPVTVAIGGIGGVTVTSDDLGPITIRRGRSDPSQRVEASTFTTTIRRSAFPGALPELGDVLICDMTPDAYNYFSGFGAYMTRRFTGKVSDAQVAQTGDSAGQTLVTVTASGHLADLAGQSFDPTIVGAGLDTAQAHAILTQLAPTVYENTGLTIVPAGSFNLLAPDPAVTDARAAFDRLSEATGGELVENRAGGLFWLPTSYREQSFGAISSLNLVPEELLAPLVWTKNRAGMVNDLSLTYGPDPQQAYALADEASAEAYGRAAVGAVTTKLADEANARHRAIDLVGARGRPSWRAGSLTIDLIRTGKVRGYTTDYNVLNNGYGQLVHLTGLPDDGPTDVLGDPITSLHVWREGDTETITRDAWTLSLDVVDYGYVGAGPTWADLPAAWTWATIPESIGTWIAFRRYSTPV